MYLKRSGLHGCTSHGDFQYNELVPHCLIYSAVACKMNSIKLKLDFRSFKSDKCSNTISVVC